MTEDQILAEMAAMLRDLLGDDSIELRMDTQREHVPNWDSFNYITFIAVAESRFGVKFKAADIESFPNVGAIVHYVSRQRGSE